MRFCYQYRTSDNVLRNGEITAGDREAAFAELRARGIRPSRMQEAPGLSNKVAGICKKWGVVALLAFVVTMSFVLLFSMHNEAEDAKKKAGLILQTLEENGTYECRGQIYGDPVFIETAFSSGWKNFFSDEADRFWTMFAVPGRPSGFALARGFPVGLVESLNRNVAVSTDDVPEVAKMKRIVNGIKREAREYLSDGGSIEGYVRRLERRQQDESMIYARVYREVSESNDPQLLAERNKSLRAMGLPMVDLSQKDE